MTEFDHSRKQNNSGEEMKGAGTAVPSCLLTSSGCSCPVPLRSEVPAHPLQEEWTTDNLPLTVKAAHKTVKTSGAHTTVNIRQSRPHIRQSQFEHTILITETGHELLTAKSDTCIRQFWEAGRD